MSLVHELLTMKPQIYKYSRNRHELDLTDASVDSVCFCTSYSNSSDEPADEERLKPESIILQQRKRKRSGDKVGKGRPCTLVTKTVVHLFSDVNVPFEPP
jgi:hypothetical protein